MKLLEKVFGNEHQKTVAKLQKTVTEINSLENKVISLSQGEMRDRISQIKVEIAGGRIVDEYTVEVFALTREAAKRTLGERHYDVQLIGGLILHSGAIAEMRTGEGKTLVATLPATLNALSGKGVHVVTVNDYLSRRDAVLMGQVYEYLGLSVSVINHESSFLYDPTHVEKDAERDEVGDHKIVYEFLKPCSRRDAYAADITYGTNNEFGFDYLRDNITLSKDKVVQRGFNFAIVDEVDSILIDEARTPLIISAPFADSAELYGVCAKVAAALTKDTHYLVEEKYKSISLTDEGITKAEELLGVKDIYTDKGVMYVHHLETAVRARALFTKDKEYVVRDGEIVIVDEFTGRMQPGRRWSDGLHQAVEAKEGVRIQEESKTLASITFQNYFRFYSKLSGMTGTADTSAEEFFKVYSLTVTTIPTHKEVRRSDHNDLIFQTEIGKFRAITQKVKELQEKGQPVLVGTTSIEKNEILSEYFKRAGVRHEVLNAKNHEREAEIIAQAGRKGSVVIATNMAGRGVDIKLGGLPVSQELQDEVRRLGGLYVIGTERHEARRIDNQLRGRSGRQGDPGETQFYVSLEDSLMRVFASDTIRSMMGKFGIPEDEPINSKLVSRSLESAQTKIEGMHFDSRKHVLQFDDVLNTQRKSIYEKRSRLLREDTEYLDTVIEDLKNFEEGSKEMIEKKMEAFGEADIRTAIRIVTLQTIDQLWVDHLEAMDYLRNSVSLRSYGQRDPLVEYKKEGLQMFRGFEHRLRGIVHGFLANLDENTAIKAPQEKQIVEGFEGEEKPASAPVQSGAKTAGRNDPCPCGRGKKVKKCDCAEYAHLR